MTGADAAAAGPTTPRATLGWIGFARLGLVQASIGAIVIFATSSLGRVMVVEYALPAFVPAALVALHYAVQVMRPRWGFGSDVGGRGTPWILAGMALLAGGNVVAALATVILHGSPVLGLALALVAYLMIGIGVGAAGTSLLVLLAKQVGPRHRAAAATIVWMMMIAGFIATAALAGTLLDPFSPGRLLLVACALSGGALVMTGGAIFGLEQPSSSANESPTWHRETAFFAAIREIWAEPQARRFTIFIFISMLAYSGQELILEPFGGLVFGLTPGASARLAGVQHAGLLAGMILVAVAGSRYAGRVLGTMRLWTIGGCVAAACAVTGIAVTGLAGAFPALRASVFVLGVADGAFSIAAIGSMMQLAAAGRPGREGTRMGLWGAAQAIAFALGGLSASTASDLARHLIDSPVRAYAIVFVAEAVLFLIAASVARAVFPRPGAARTDASPRLPPAADYEGARP